MVTMTAKAVFKCHPSSHHFDERHIRLSEPVKIGRSVAKARPTLDNGIFDCKVLSRNHALISYDVDSSKFFLQDTKSSNGTFVNNNRLSRGSEESPAHEICSGDIVQFGVDVMENCRRGVVTHGCIVAQLSLFHQDGTEATRSDSSLQGSCIPGFANQSGPGNNNVPSQELYQLSHYLKEALHREQMLEQKLVALQRLVSSTQEATDTSWQALIDEDRLLSRLEVVENQLRAYSKANTEESIRKELIALQEDKSNYEKTVKDSLKKALEEKLEACRKVADTERMLSNSEDECSHVREELENLRQEQELLLEKCSQLEQDGQELAQRGNEADRQHQEEVERLREELRETKERLGQVEAAEGALSARIEELQAENDFIREQLVATKERLEETQEALQLAGSQIEEAAEQSLGQERQENKDNKQPSPAPEQIEGKTGQGTQGKVPTEGEDVPVHHISLIPNGDDRTPTRESGVQVESLWREAANREMNGKAHENTDGAMMDSVKTLRNTAEESVMRELHRYRYQLEEAQEKLAERDSSMVSLRSELTAAHQQVEQHRQEVTALEQRLQDAEARTAAAVERSVTELRERLSPGRGGDGGGDEADSMRDNDSETSSIQTLVEEPLIGVSVEERQMAAAPRGRIASSGSPAVTPGDEKGEGSLHNHIHDETLSNSRELEATLLEIDTLKDELHTLRQKYSQLAVENDGLSTQLTTAHQDSKAATDRANTLQVQVGEAEQSSKAVRDQLPILQEKLQKESQLVQKRTQAMEGLEKKLGTANNKVSSSQAELSKCKESIQSLSRDLEREKDARRDLEKGIAQVVALQADLEKEKKEKARLQEEAKQLQQRLAQLEERLGKKGDVDATRGNSVTPSKEADLKSSRLEKETQQAEIARLQKLLEESESEKRRLAALSSDGNVDTLSSEAEKENLQKQLTKAEGELQRLRLASEPGTPELDSLKQRLETVTQELTRAKANNAMVQMKWLPVCVIGIAILAAVFQSLLAMWVEV